jgi:hypothetical protein
MVLLFGSDQNAVNQPNLCISYANVAGPSTCITSGFTGSNGNIVFGPVPGPPLSTMTISHLAAAASSVSSPPVTITVLVDGAVTTPTALTCTVTTGTTCNDDTDTVTVHAGDFLEVSVTGGTNWLVTFELG